MALVDDVEFYGRAVAAGEMSVDQAVELLVQASSGGYTPYGAALLLEDWTGARAKYEKVFRETGLLLDRLLEALGQQSDK